MYSNLIDKGGEIHHYLDILWMLILRWNLSIK